MTEEPTARAELLAALEGTLELLQRDGGIQADESADEPGLPLPSLLAQCADRVAALEAAPARPVRTLHHMACTGGTLIAKALAAMPNTVMMSEIDPLSTLHLRAPRPPFLPTDLIAGLRYSPRGIGEETIQRMFGAALSALHDDLGARGLTLVLRDHAHSQFCTHQNRHARPTLYRMVADILPVRAVVTVRHPLDSFLSLRNNKWLHFEPATFEEYCLRYSDFLDAHAGLPLWQYEAFVADPAGVLQEICAALDLSFSPGFEALLPLMALSGDSGRSGTMISSRPRRAVPGDLQDSLTTSAAYARLCERLEYPA
ncbi:sulfotransferase [Puniceibacterium confluentis]|uniref:sulfotransferase n=1 Tax=Puniceibacterium confluentis TaxID=1958944 RepID=UPI0011B37E3A|nr:sulfotransferase [Puniceibacterium confluentis]